MILKDDDFVDLPTPNGPMRTYVFRPAAEGRYPGLVLFSEIFQVTGPIRRTAALLAGSGFVVAVPEIYHEFTMNWSRQEPSCLTTRQGRTVATCTRRPKSWRVMTPPPAPRWTT